MDSPNEQAEIFYLALIGVLLLLALAAGMIWLYVSSQNRNLRKQKELDQQKIRYQQQLLTANLRGQEAERKRLAKELHDGVNGALAAIKLQLSLPTVSGEATTPLRESLDSVMAEVRATSHALLPPGFEQRGLVSITEGLCNQYSDFGTFEVIFRCNEPERRFASERELQVYRIVQELLNNCEKYAEAGRVDLHLDFGEEQLSLRYEDDGKGFDYQPTPDGPSLAGLGLGMSNIQTRTDFLGGKMDLESAPGEGVRARLEIKISKRGAADAAATAGTDR